MTSDKTENKMLFGRYTREECGLPPDNADAFGERLSIPKTLVILAVLAGAAWLGGWMVANYRELWVRQLPSRIAQAGNDGELRSGLMRRGAMFAAALPERPRVRRDLAFAAMTAAEQSPRRLGYIGNALALLDGAGAAGAETAETATAAAADETPLETVMREMALSGLHEEAGEYREAFAALDRAEKALSGMTKTSGAESGQSGQSGQNSRNEELAKLQRSFRLLLVNAQAYCLATAGKGEGGNPARALELSRLAVSSRDELPGGGFASESAAFVDTLAAARFETGDAAAAAEAQRLALGLADSQGLEVYLEHFDTFDKAASASKGEAHVQ